MALLRWPGLLPRLAMGAPFPDVFDHARLAEYRAGGRETWARFMWRTVVGAVDGNQTSEEACLWLTILLAFAVICVTTCQHMQIYYYMFDLL